MSDAITKARRTLGFLTKPSLCKPRGARLVVTANCNFKCQMCTFWGKHHQDPSLETVKYWIKEMAEFGIRLASNQKKISTQFGKIKNLVIEASYWAKKAGSQAVKAEHVEKALKEI